MIKDTEIQQVQSSTYLGVTTDHDLTFNLPVDCTVNKANCALGALLKASLKLYPSGHSHHYVQCAGASSVRLLCHCLGHCGWYAQIKQLQKIQDRGMLLNFIFRCARRTCIRTMLSKLKWFSTKQLIRLLTCVSVYKRKNHLGLLITWQTPSIQSATHTGPGPICQKTYKFHVHIPDALQHLELGTGMNCHYQSTLRAPSTLFRSHAPTI